MVLITTWSSSCANHFTMDFLSWTQPPRAIVALLECAILGRRKKMILLVYTVGSLSASDNSASHHASPHPRVAQSPLMHWAYHISRTIATTTWRTRRLTQLQLQLARKPLLLNDDEFDDHQYILNIRDTMRTMPDGLSFDSVLWRTKTPPSSADCKSTSSLSAGLLRLAFFRVPSC
jgi:hypothetical protein